MGKLKKRWYMYDHWNYVMDFMCDENYPKGRGGIMGIVLGDYQWYLANNEVDAHYSIWHRE